MKFIQFTGAQSTGKTTIAKKLVEFFKEDNIHVSFIGEISRKFKKQGIVKHIDIEASSAEQFLLTSELLLQYLENYNKKNEYGITLAERSPICCLAYSRHLNNKTLIHSHILDQTERFIKYTQTFSNFYTFYFPILTSFENDGIRNEKSRALIDMEIQNILRDFKIPYYSLTSLNFDQRIRDIYKYIKYNEI